jgi:hypothetical protein
MLTLCWFALQAASALAILPPDANLREPQLRAARIKMRERYEQRHLERQALAVREYKKTEAAVFLPPWERNRINADGTVRPVSAAEAAAAAAAHKQENGNKRLMVSLVLLLLIGGGALWARHLTQDKKEQNA